MRAERQGSSQKADVLLPFFPLPSSAQAAAAPSCTSCCAVVAAPSASIRTSASPPSSVLSPPAPFSVGGGGNLGNSANGGSCAGSILSGELVVPAPGGATRSGWVSFQSSLPSLSSSISEKMILRGGRRRVCGIQCTDARRGDRNPQENREGGRRTGTDPGTLPCRRTTRAREPCSSDARSRAVPSLRT